MKIAISTHKGGVGKTVTSINLAASLSGSLKTLIVDLDPQGHASLGLGVNANFDSVTISDILSDPKASPEKAIVKITDSLSLIPSNIKLARVAESLYSSVRREERLNLALSKLTGYDIIIFDCPPSLGTLTANALTSADFILIPCEIGARAADGLVDLLEILSLLKGQQFENWRILLTKYDARKTVSNEAVLKSLESYKDKILQSKIGVAESLNQAQIVGKDIFRFDPDGRGAEYYDKVKNELLKIWGMAI